MTQPYEVIAAPLEIWIAPVGEAFPAVDAVPAGNWVRLGTLGSREYAEDGVTITHDETVEDYYGLGSTGMLKSFRTQEQLMVSVMVNDLTLEQYRARLNFNTVAEQAAGASQIGYKSVDMYKGLDVAERALLIRGDGKSPYGDGFNMQWQIPRARPDGTTEVVFTKGEPAGLQMDWMVLEDVNASSAGKRFGEIIQQTANATS